MQVVVALSQTYGSPQTPPPLSAVQQAWPRPPQAVQVLPEPHAVNGAVHETPPAQHVSPRAPHDGPEAGTHAPAVHVPSLLPQADAAATHLLVLWSQHPPPLQRLSSQHGSPAAPQVAQRVPAALQLEVAVQNFATSPLPFGLPGQHAMPLVPQGFTAPVPVPPVHDRAGDPPAFLHVPSTVSPQDVPAAMHSPSTQQSPAVVQLSPWQQAFPVAPQATDDPLSQTFPVVVSSPEATHTFALQQPPPVHAVPVAQQGSPTPPQETHAVPLQTVLAVLQLAPLATHFPSAPSQQPPGQELPAQQTSPLVPHAVQLPPVQMALPVHDRSFPMQVLLVGSQQSPEVPAHPVPGQQVLPVVPQARQVPAEQYSPEPVQALPAQHGSPTPPHDWHDDPVHTVLAVEHARSLPTQVLLDGSQQSPGDPGQELPEQQAAPVVPHARQLPPEQISLLAQALFAQQA